MTAEFLPDEDGRQPESISFWPANGGDGGTGCSSRTVCITKIQPPGGTKFIFFTFQTVIIVIITTIKTENTKKKKKNQFIFLLRRSRGYAERPHYLIMPARNPGNVSGTNCTDIILLCSPFDWLRDTCDIMNNGVQNLRAVSGKRERLQRGYIFIPSGTVYPRTLIPGSAFRSRAHGIMGPDSYIPEYRHLAGGRMGIGLIIPNRSLFRLIGPTGCQLRIIVVTYIY